ncbi:hypothetical protein [Nocardia sp. NPDC019395]|uniref:hypothetical protein n=1 Tax=Nocardia sp. NPDC019395 TaxID=3154686 RepID=UPI0033C271D1
MTIAIYPSADTDWAQWHTRYAARLRSPHSGPDPIAQHWIGESPEQLPGLPGTWWVVDGRVFIAAKPGDRLDHDGTRIAGIEILDPVDDAPGIILRHDEHAVEIIRRNGQTSIRVHAPAD